VRADRPIYAALETMQALLDTQGIAQLVVVDFAADVARATVHVQGAGRRSIDTLQLQDLLEAFGCCTCDRSLRSSICAHQILALLRHHCLLDTSESEQRRFFLKAMHFLAPYLEPLTHAQTRQESGHLSTRSSSCGHS
jgi:hypothetical protein